MVKHCPTLISMALSLLAGLAACDSGPSVAPASPPAPFTPEQVAARMATLPAPYVDADYENGRRVFARCRACHTVHQGGPDLTGPNLYSLFGRTAGKRDGYTYSRALREAGFAWDAQRLDRWLAQPRGFLPGNKMTFAGIADEGDRRDLIAWLKVETGPRD